MTTMTFATIEKRYPHLLRHMRAVAFLSAAEAASALSQYIAAKGGLIAAESAVEGGCEAVANYGGPARVITDAIRLRNMIRQLLATPETIKLTPQRVHAVDAAMSHHTEYAFTVIVKHGTLFTLSVCPAGKAQSFDIPPSWARSTSHTPMSEHAHELNAANGLTPADAIRIINATGN